MSYLMGFLFAKDINCDGVAVIKSKNGGPLRNVCKAFAHYDFPEMSGWFIHTKRTICSIRISSQGAIFLQMPEQRDRAEKMDNAELSVDSTSSHLLSGYLKGRSFDPSSITWGGG